jgi:hypothetical protein
MVARDEPAWPTLSIREAEPRGQRPGLALNAERHAEEVKLGLVSPDGKRLKRADDDEDGDADDEADAADATPTKAGSKKSPAAKPKSAKGKKANLTGQLDFGGDE